MVFRGDIVKAVCSPGRRRVVRAGWLSVLLCVVMMCVAGCSRRGSVTVTFEDDKPTADSVAILLGGSITDQVEQVMGGGKAATRADVTGTNGTRAGATRAADPLEDIYTTFTVWAYKTKSGAGTVESPYSTMQTVIPGYTVTWGENTAHTTTSNTSDWEYVGGSQTIKYWDMGATSYRFFGAAPAEDDTPVDDRRVSVSVGETAAVMTVKDVDVSTTAGIDDCPYVSDMWFSHSGIAAFSAGGYGSTVQLQFRKPLCKVRIMFRDMEGEEFTNVSQISFAPITTPNPVPEEIETGDIPAIGTISLRYPLTGTGTAREFAQLVYTIEGDDDKVVISEPYTAEQEKWYTVLPNALQPDFLLRATTSRANNVVVPSAYTQWLPGYSYTYIFKVLENSLRFDELLVGIADWEEHPENHPVYNW